MAGRRILLLRHAEKTGETADVHLSPEGYARASRLADYIPQAYGVPQYLIATAPSKHSIRPIETITPLATRIGQPIAALYMDDAYAALAAELMSAPRYEGALTVVCWHHGKIPKLARALAAPDGTYPSPWDENVFDLVIELMVMAGGPTGVVLAAQPF